LTIVSSGDIWAPVALPVRVIERGMNALRWIVMEPGARVELDVLGEVGSGPSSSTFQRSTKAEEEAPE
jgi:hypothetical protein